MLHVLVKIGHASDYGLMQSFESEYPLVPFAGDGFFQVSHHDYAGLNRRFKERDEPDPYSD